MIVIDNGTEMTSRPVLNGPIALASPGPTAPGKPHGFVESFNGRLRDECLNQEVFDTIAEARDVIERGRSTKISSGPIRPTAA